MREGLSNFEKSIRTFQKFLTQQRLNRFEVRMFRVLEPLEDDRFGADDADSDSPHAVQRVLIVLQPARTNRVFNDEHFESRAARSSAVCNTQIWASMPTSTTCRRSSWASIVSTNRGNRRS